jgi:para-nitrobenzyl esterase
MVFIHGGGNTGGATSDIMFKGSYFYDGEQLAARGDVVVVTVEYRLGALGFLAHPALSAESGRAVSGNYGSLDQIAALKWVQRNIDVFGGDPDRVTLFGESGGARDVCTLVSSPLAQGLFARAILESGACNQPTLDQREVDGEDIAALVGCPSPTDVDCLRNTSVQAWLDAVGGGGDDSGFVNDNIIGPNIDGYVLTDSPWNVLTSGTNNAAELLIGANTDETATMVGGVPPLPDAQAYADYVDDIYGALAPDVLRLYPASDYPTPLDAFISVTTDQQFICPMWRVVRGAAANSQPVYWYRFRHTLDHPDYEDLGAFHGIELYYLFQHMDDLPDYTPSADDLDVEEAMWRYWTSFAATGDPNSGGGLPVWAPYSTTSDKYHSIDATIADTPEDRTEKCEFWIPMGI